MFAREDGPVGEHLCQDTPHRPNINFEEREREEWREGGREWPATYIHTRMIIHFIYTVQKTTQKMTEIA